MSQLDAGSSLGETCRMYRYRTLDSVKIIETIDQLERRILGRFPQSGLGRVCSELGQIARAQSAEVERLARPNWWIRAAVIATVVLGFSLIAVIAQLLRTMDAKSDLFTTLQGIDAGLNLFVLMGAMLFFLFSLEARAKRHRALADLHKLRSIIHVIDMHQLTKDPTMFMDGATRVKTSPNRTMTPFELMRYLDYCSEMLSLAAKVAALYAQNLTDTELVDAVNDLERLTTNLSQKMWQKISLVETSIRASRERGGLVDRPAKT
jgi:hypothetical protein